MQPTITDYTLDLETMGTNGTSAILSIGACAFNRNAEMFNPNETAAFYVNVDLDNCLKHGLTLDAPTIHWWMKQNKKARSAFESPPPVGLKHAIKQYSDWVKDIGGRNIPCWTHATFDAPILGNACRAIQRNLNQITAYKMQRDIRTLNDLKGYYEVDRKGEHHNALDDAVFQAEYIWGLLNGKGTKD